MEIERIKPRRKPKWSDIVDIEPVEIQIIDPSSAWESKEEQIRIRRNELIIKSARRRFGLDPDMSTPPTDEGDKIMEDLCW